MPFSLEKSPFPETWELGEGLKSLLSCFFLSNSYCHWREICWVCSDAKPQISDLNSRGDVNRNPARGRGTPLSRARSSRCPLGLAPVARGTRLLLGGAGQWRWDRGQGLGLGFGHRHCRSCHLNPLNWNSVGSPGTYNVFSKGAGGTERT